MTGAFPPDANPPLVCALNLFPHERLCFFKRPSPQYGVTRPFVVLIVVVGSGVGRRRRRFDVFQTKAQPTTHRRRDY